MSLQSPHDLGLPLKFRDWRDQQEETIERIATSSKKLFLLDSPTGTGKSIMSVAAGKISSKKTLYLCTTKNLQNQLATDFPNAVVLKGRGNYVCAKFPNDFPRISAAECTKLPKQRKCDICKYPRQKELNCFLLPKDEPCPCGQDCEYTQTKKSAISASLAVLNTHLFLVEANFIGGFSGFPFVVLDEADTLESTLLSFVEVSITKRQIDKLELELPEKKTVASSWVDWINNDALPVIEQRLADLKLSSWALDNVKETNMLTGLRGKFRFAAKEIPNGNWVFMPEEDRWTFKPVFVSKYAEDNLWKHGDRFLAMSATLINPYQFCRNLGVDVNDTEVITLDSPFPPENRPVYYVPVANMTHKLGKDEWDKIVSAIDNILNANPDKKVLVHTVSYVLALHIIQNSKYGASRMIMHKNAMTRNEVLKEFENSGQPLVLLSPSMDRGVDLPGEKCDIIVIAKMPFLSLGDKQVSARLYGAKDGNEWYATETVRSIVQASGRAMRSKDDHCITYILDSQFGRLYRQNFRLFPKWWLRALHMI